MTRSEVEWLLVHKLEEIRKIVRLYNPENKYLSMCIIGNNLSANNSYWEKGNSESEYPINFSIEQEGGDE